MSDVSKIKVEEVLYNVKDSQLQAHKIANNPHNINAQTIGLDKVDNLSKDELKEYIEQGIDGDLTKVKQDIEDLQLDVIDLQNADKDKLDLKITDTQSVNSSVIFNKDITVSGSNICGNEDEEIDATKFWNFPDGISIRGKEAMIDAEASAVIAAIEEVECNVTVTDGVAKFFFKLPKGQDNVGPKGEKGSKWISSELLVGTVDFYTTTLNVDIDDWGLNPETGMFYRCTSATTSQQNWSYIGTFQGPQGEKGDTGNEGPKGDDGADGTIFYTSATIEPGEEETQADFIFNDIEDVNLYDYVINTISQVMYKCFSIDEEGNKHFSYSMSLGGMQGQQGERGEKGDQGIQGEPGISPTVTVYSETDDEYILTITDVDNPSGYQTPNLKGENGMNIIPNPEEEGTEDLNKIQIDDVIYNVVGSGGGGTGNIVSKSVSEYNALTTEEKNNGSLYMIKTDEEDAGTDVLSSCTWTGDTHTTKIDNKTISFSDVENNWSSTNAIYTELTDFSQYDKITLNLTNFELSSNAHFFISKYNDIVNLAGNNWQNTLALISSGDNILYSCNTDSLPEEDYITIDISEFNDVTRLYFGVTTGVNELPWSATCNDSYNGSCNIVFDKILLQKENEEKKQYIYYMNDKYAQYPGSGGSGETTSKYITLANYNELPIDEKMDGTFYYISYHRDVEPGETILFKTNEVLDVLETPVLVSSSANDGGASVSAEYVYIYKSYGSSTYGNGMSGVYQFSKSIIDFSQFDAIRIRGFGDDDGSSAWGPGYFAVLTDSSPNLTTFNESQWTKINSESGEFEKVIDITNINNKGHLIMSLNHNSNVYAYTSRLKIYEITLITY